MFSFSLLEGKKSLSFFSFLYFCVFSAKELQTAEWAMTEQGSAAPHCRVCWKGQDRGGVTLGQSMGQHPSVSTLQILYFPQKTLIFHLLYIFWNIQTFVSYFRTTAGCRMLFNNIKFRWGLKSGHPSDTEENSTQQRQAGIYPNSLCVRDKSNHPKRPLKHFSACCQQKEN